MIKGAVFDIDGTILDSMSIWTDAGVRYLKSLDIESEKGLSEKLRCMTMEQAASYLNIRYSLNKTTDYVVNEFVNIFEDFYANEVLPKEGAVDFLKDLYNAGIPISIATSNDIRCVKKAFSRIGILDYFSGIFTCGELNTNKFKPDIFYKASEKFNCRLDEIYVFEDTLHALRTAHKSGFKTIGVYDATSENDMEEIKSFCDCYIRNFNEINLSML